MAKSSNDLSNYQRYLNNMKHRGYTNLPIPDHEETIDELIAEGDMLLAKVTVPTNTWISKPDAPTKNNPYKEAYNRVLAMMDDDLRSEILLLKKEGKTDSRKYQEFISQVCKLGDKLSQ